MQIKSYYFILADMFINTLKANFNSFFTVWFQIQKEFITPSTIAEQMPTLVLCVFKKT